MHLGCNHHRRQDGMWALTDVQKQQRRRPWLVLCTCKHANLVICNVPHCRCNWNIGHGCNADDKRQESVELPMLLGG